MPQERQTVSPARTGVWHWGQLKMGVVAGRTGISERSITQARGRSKPARSTSPDPFFSGSSSFVLRHSSPVPSFVAYATIAPSSPQEPLTMPTPNWTEVTAETIRHLQALLRLDTTNLPGNEILAAEYLAGVLRAEGIEPLVL